MNWQFVRNSFTPTYLTSRLAEMTKELEKYPSYRRGVYTRGQKLSDADIREGKEDSRTCGAVIVLNLRRARI